MKGILGRKIGMTQVFTTDGKLIPVTVVEATPNVVLQKKTVATDGYDAVQVGFEDLREKLANNPLKGHVKKAETAPKRFIKEFRYDEMMSYEVGQEIKVDSCEKEGCWSSIGTNQPNKQSGKVCTFMIPHGTKPNGASYAYAVVPAVSKGGAEDRLEEVIKDG